LCQTFDAFSYPVHLFLKKWGREKRGEKERKRGRQRERGRRKSEGGGEREVQRKEEGRKLGTLLPFDK
jgi:hypothetical protein